MTTALSYLRNSPLCMINILLYIALEKFATIS